MRLDEQFNDAQARVKTLPSQSNSVLLDLYALFKQASDGDATGTRPGMMDMRGRAKYDARAGRKGMTKEEAKKAYVELVNRLGRG